MTLTSMIKQPGSLLSLAKEYLGHSINEAHDHWVAYSKIADQQEWMQFLTVLKHNDHLLLDYWQLADYHLFLFEGRYDYHCIENYLNTMRISVSSSPVLNSRTEASFSYCIDHAWIDEQLDLSKPGLLLMDMDCTAIKSECINEMADIAGVGEQVKALTSQAMRGELNFEQSLRQRVALVAGLAVSELELLKNNLPWMEELSLLVTTLQKQNWSIAVASGGFTYFAAQLQKELQLTAIFANELEIVNGLLTGKLIGEIIGPQQKAQALTFLQQQFKVPPSNCIAIGDGANDLAMLAQAQIGIAYHAKPTVNELAHYKILYADLGGVLCLISALILLNKLKKEDTIK